MDGSNTDLLSCGPDSCAILVSPMPIKKPLAIDVNARAKKRRVVFIDSRKPNSRTIIEQARVLLAARGVELGGVIEKPSAARPLSEEALDRLMKEEGLVVSAVND